MKYKINDRIQVVKQRYTSSVCSDINKILAKHNYILTVKEVDNNLCAVMEMTAKWSTANIVKEMPIPITSKFEILDL